MNKTIKQILEDSYMITYNDNQWIFTNEEGEQTILSDTQLLEYENYIIDNIESFGYSKSDLSESNQSSLDYKENISPRDLKIQKKQQKKEAKQQKKEAKQQKKEAKLKAKELKIEKKLESYFDDEYLDSLQKKQEEQATPNMNKSQNNFYDENNYSEPQIEQTTQYDNFQTDNVQNDSNNYHQENNMTNQNDSNNYHQENNMTNQNDSNHFYKKNNLNEQNSLNNYYSQNIDNKNNQKNVIQSTPIHIDLTEIERQSNDEITKSIISNINATKKSVDSLRKFLQEVKEI